MRASAPLQPTRTAASPTFGDPTPVLSGFDLSGLYYAAWTGRYYTPPVDFNGLARVFLANPHHKSAVDLKVTRVAARFIPSTVMTRQTLRRLAQDLLVFGNAFAVVRRNRLGRVVTITPLLARWVRVGQSRHRTYEERLSAVRPFDL